MNNMLKLASLSGVALGILSTVAVAADLPSRRAPAPYIAPPPVFTWTGFYIGLNAGAAFRTNTNQNNNANLFFLTGNPIFLTGNNNNNNNVAFVGGGQIGYNWQTGPVVFGLEADAQYRSSFGGNNGNNFFGGGNNNNDGFLGTARGRIGYSITPMFMVYATGGAAFGNTFNGNQNNNFFFGGFGNNNNNNFRVGYTVGGGVEYAFAPNWSVKAEYLFVDLGRNSQNGFNFGGGGGNRSQAHVARLGVNYRFNMGVPAPVVARY